MTNNTIANVPRELLERAWRALANSATGREIGAYLDADPCAPECAETCARASMCSTCSAILSATSPAGVDGLEVVAYRVSLPSEPELGTWLDDDAENEPQMCLHEPLCRLSDAQAIIDGLRGEVAKINSDRLACWAEFKVMTRACLDAEKERDQQAQRIGELEGLLRESYEDGEYFMEEGLLERIDAALSAGKEGE